jgi:hypothetical protein
MPRRRWLGVIRTAGPSRYLYLQFGPSLRTARALDAAIAAARRRAYRLGCALRARRRERGDVSPAEVAPTGARRVRSQQYEHTLVVRTDVDEATLRRPP